MNKEELSGPGGSLCKYVSYRTHTGSSASPGGIERVSKIVMCIGTVTFADSYLRANIEFRNKACTRGKYYSYTEVIFVLFIFIYVYRHIYVRHVLAVALASLP